MDLLHARGCLGVDLWRGLVLADEGEGNGSPVAAGVSGRELEPIVANVRAQEVVAVFARNEGHGEVSRVVVIRVPDLNPHA